MKIYIDTTADPKNALIAGQADNQAATMPTLFYGDVLPFQVMFTDGFGNPAEFSGQANNEVIFAIGVLVPHQTYAKTQIMAYANGCYYADLDLNTIGLENALAGNESVNLTFEIQLNNGVGQSTTLAQGICTVRNQLNLFSAVNSTLPAAPSAVNATDSTPETVPAAPSTIQISQTTTDGQLLILQDFTYGGFSGTAGQIIEVLSWVGQRPYVAKQDGQELLPVSLKNTHWEIYAQNVLIPSNPSNINILENKPYIVYGNDGTNGLGYYYPVYLYDFGLSQYHTHNFGDRIVTGNWENGGNTTIIGEFLTVLQTQDNGGRQYQRSDGTKIWSSANQYNNLTIAAQDYYMENTAVNHAATYPTNTDLEIAPGTQAETLANAPSEITVLNVFSSNDIGREIILLPGSGLLNINWATLQIGNIYTTTNVDTNNNRIGFLDDNQTFVWIDDATKAYGRQLGVDWEFREAETQEPAAPSGIILASVPVAPSNITLSTNLIDSVTPEAHGQFPGTGTFSSETGAGDITINNENYSSAYAFTSDGNNFSYYQTLNFNNDGSITLVSTDEFDNDGNNSNYGNDTTYNLGTWTTTGINFNTNWHGVGEDYINDYFNNFKLVYGEIQTVPAAPSVPTVQELDYSFISFEGQTYDLIEEASNGITVTPRTNSSGNITASRVNDDGEILIQIPENSLWGSENNQSLHGPVFNLKQSDPEAHYVAVSCTGSGNTNIITQNLGAYIFENGTALGAINKWIAHEGNIIPGSTTRSKTIIELVWRNISNEIIKAEYYKIGFEEIQTVPAAPSVLTVQEATPSTITVYHGTGGTLDSELRSQTNVPTNSSEYTDIYGMTYGDGNYYRVHIPLPEYANNSQWSVTVENETIGVFSGQVSPISNSSYYNASYTIVDGTVSKAALRGRTIIRINWLDSDGNALANEAVLRLNLID